MGKLFSRVMRKENRYPPAGLRFGECPPVDYSDRVATQEATKPAIQDVVRVDLTATTPISVQVVPVQETILAPAAEDQTSLGVVSFYLIPTV